MSKPSDTETKRAVAGREVAVFDKRKWDVFGVARPPAVDVLFFNPNII